MWAVRQPQPNSHGDRRWAGGNKQEGTEHRQQSSQKTPVDKHLTLMSVGLSISSPSFHKDLWFIALLLHPWALKARFRSSLNYIYIYFLVIAFLLLL